jgi:hypothetical protein
MSGPNGNYLRGKPSESGHNISIGTPVKIEEREALLLF